MTAKGYYDPQAYKPEWMESLPGVLKVAGHGHSDIADAYACNECTPPVRREYWGNPVGPECLAADGKYTVQSTTKGIVLYNLETKQRTFSSRPGGYSISEAREELEAFQKSLIANIPSRSTIVENCAICDSPMVQGVFKYQAVGNIDGFKLDLKVCGNCLNTLKTAKEIPEDIKKASTIMCFSLLFLLSVGLALIRLGIVK